MGAKWHEHPINKDESEFIFPISPDPSSTLKQRINLRYHSEWNWIMPVVNKCLDMLEQVDGNSSDEQRMHIGEALQEAKIEDLYASVIRCIKWYNNQIK